MTERWQAELRKLDRLGPRQGAWDEVPLRPAPTSRPGRSPGSRLAAGAVALVLVAGAAYAGWIVTRSDTRRIAPAAEDGPLLTITCSDRGTQVSPHTIAMQRDGVHFHVDNPGGSIHIQVGDELLIRMDKMRSLTDVRPLSPGQHGVTCSQRNHKTFPPEEAADLVRVVDPHGYWPALEQRIGCGDPEPPPAVQPTGVIEPSELSGELLIELEEGGQGDIYRVGADLSMLQPLEPVVVGPSDDGGAHWSPDGQRVVFTSRPDTGHVNYAGASEIVVADVDGTNITPVTDNPDSEDVFPSWSPDGTSIMYRGGRGVHVVDSDGSGERPLGESSGEPGGWSPDGQYILYVEFPESSDRNETYPLELPCGRAHIAIQPAAGGPVRHLTRNEAYNAAPTWSPDGRSIAFMRSDRSDYAWDILVLDIESGRETRLTDHPGFDGSPIWSPDGSMLAFASDRDASPKQIEKSMSNDGVVGDLEWFVMTADGSRVGRLPVAGWVTDWR